MSILTDVYKIERANGASTTLLSSPLIKHFSFDLNDIVKENNNNSTIFWNFGDHESKTNEIVSSSVTNSVVSHSFLYAGIYNIHCIANVNGVLFHSRVDFTINADLTSSFVVNSSGTIYIKSEETTGSPETSGGSGSGGTGSDYHIHGSFFVNESHFGMGYIWQPLSNLNYFPDQTIMQLLPLGSSGDLVTSIGGVASVVNDPNATTLSYVSTLWGGPVVRIQNPDDMSEFLFGWNDTGNIGTYNENSLSTYVDHFFMQDTPIDENWIGKTIKFILTTTTGKTISVDMLVTTS